MSQLKTPLWDSIVAPCRATLELTGVFKPPVVPIYGIYGSRWNCLAAVADPSSCKFWSSVVLERCFFYETFVSSSKINFPTLLDPMLKGWAFDFGLLFLPFSLTILFH